MELKVLITVTLAGLFFPALTSADFFIYFGTEVIPVEGGGVFDRCYFVRGHPSCNDVAFAPSGTLNINDGDLSGPNSHGCICDAHNGNDCFQSPHLIQRTEFRINAIGHYSTLS